MSYLKINRKIKSHLPTYQSCPLSRHLLTSECLFLLSYVQWANGIPMYRKPRQLSTNSGCGGLIPVHPVLRIFVRIVLNDVKFTTPNLSEEGLIIGCEADKWKHHLWQVLDGWQQYLNAFYPQLWSHEPRWQKLEYERALRLICEEIGWNWLYSVAYRRA